MTPKQITKYIGMFFTSFGALYFILSLFNQGFGMEIGLLAMILGEVIDIEKEK
jgi:hypothetical protein